MLTSIKAPTFQRNKMADVLCGTWFVMMGAYMGLRIVASLAKTNFSELGPTLLSLFEYTAAIRNLKEISKKLLHYKYSDLLLMSDKSLY